MCDGDCPDGVSTFAVIRVNGTDDIFPKRRIRQKARLFVCAFCFLSRNIYFVFVRLGLDRCLKNVTRGVDDICEWP